MPDLFAKLAQEWPVITGAPIIACSALVAITLFVWAIVQWSFKARMDSRDAEIALIQRQRDDYKDKLNGASPDEAKARMDALEARLLLVEPRRLMAEQRSALTSRLLLPIGMRCNVAVLCDAACSDCSTFASDIALAIRKAEGWSAVEPMVMGPGVKSPLGLLLIITEQSKILIGVETLRRALQEANIHFDTHIGRLTSPNVVAELLVTSRIQQ